MWGGARKFPRTHVGAPCRPRFRACGGARRRVFLRQMGREWYRAAQLSLTFTLHLCMIFVAGPRVRGGYGAARRPITFFGLWGQEKKKIIVGQGQQGQQDYCFSDANKGRDAAKVQK
jgi:hypothetical protein